MTAPSRTDSNTSHEPWQAKVVHDGDLPVAWGVSPDKDKAQTAATSAAERHLECPVHLLSTAEASP